MKTTPTDIPIRKCETCGVEHPITRAHCTNCGRASLFISPRDGVCIHCRPEDWP